MEQKSVRAVIVLGVNKGYGENIEKNPLLKASTGWQRIAAQVYKESGIYISAIANESKAIYHTEWDCPVGGEDTVTFTTSANREYVNSLEAWKDAVLTVTKRLKEEFEQYTVTVEFESITLVYLD
ncbi:hypothetical protein [Peribacillus acanthi]|uniref:hypothetical protein n=1 Tax=Peribacillus acanthi TaxID=2171554 RepID=UPI000D3EB175|nr:hypothetical protein [Peribacillus acanthi]